MKRMRIVLALIVLTFAYACAQEQDHEFKVPIKVISITFPDGTVQTTALPVIVTTTWDSLAGKPNAFPPTPHTHAWVEITDKPGTIELIEAISQLGYLPIPQKTTAEIDAMVLPVDKSGIVLDKTLNVYKVWAKTYWKILITAN